MVFPHAEVCMDGIRSKTPSIWAAVILLSWFAVAGCRTLPQATVGYLVPGGDFHGALRTYKACGTPGAWTFVMDEKMLDKAQQRLSVERQSMEKAPAITGYSVDIDLNLPSCYILSAFQEDPT